MQPELISLIKLVAGVVNVSIKAEADGKLSYTDIPLLMELVPLLGPAFANISAIPHDISVLQQADVEEIVSEIASDLAIGEGHAKNVVVASLAAVSALFKLYGAIKSP